MRSQECSGAREDRVVCDLASMGGVELFCKIVTPKLYQPVSPAWAGT